ncbi:hypothetical protein B296_00012319 [Ensete ventricosum]|uniref:Retrotransposon gag domain-containing protein n=1 Tax=Ensete ventricosum TaxID=4639 RepID=A0A426ZR94_ENSVE|nr:hypothetical protein B296_00012319 [Ensete ventricosum]
MLPGVALLIQISYNLVFPYQSPLPTSPNCRKDGARLAPRTTDSVVSCGSMVSNKEDTGLGYGYPRPTRAPPLEEPTSQARPEGSSHPTELHLCVTTAGELAHTGLNQQCPLSRHGGRPHLLGRHKRFSTNILALEGGPMSQERSFGNSGAEHHSEPNHSQPAEEVTTAGPTRNHFWRMMIDPGFPSPASKRAPFVVTAEAFLGLTNQVQALAVPCGPEPVDPTRDGAATAEAHTASPTAAPAQSQSRSCDPVQTSPDFDTLSSDTADSLREQVRQVHQRLDKVQKEVLKSKGRSEKALKALPQIFFQIREKGLLKAPNPMKSHFERRDKRRYYRFHREYGHNTEECHDLQYQIEDLIRHEHLRRYVHDQSSLPTSRPPRDSLPRPKGPVEKQIDIIFGGPASGDNSSSARKAYARSEVGKRPVHDEDLDITFKSGGEEYPCHDDALVISIRMANACVKRVMIDTRSLADILYFDAFQKLGLTDKDLVTLTSTLTGFTRDFCPEPRIHKRTPWPDLCPLAQPTHRREE